MQEQGGQTRRKMRKNSDSLEQFSCCQACKRESDALLILPCSHHMCVPCIEAEGTRSSEPRRCRASLQVCSVLCPSCRHPVELPCWNWSSATSCLPKHPTLNPECHVREPASAEPLEQVRDSNRIWNLMEVIRL